MQGTLLWLGHFRASAFLQGASTGKHEHGSRPAGMRRRGTPFAYALDALLHILPSTLPSPCVQKQSNL